MTCAVSVLLSIVLPVEREPDSLFFLQANPAGRRADCIVLGRRRS